ncbi:MAG: hypothetical protein JXJ04_09190 [Spirochaetales bacterium]|nr:hypothetical protein [Spirochaetales bacterium]
MEKKYRIILISSFFIILLFSNSCTPRKIPEKTQENNQIEIEPELPEIVKKKYEQFENLKKTNELENENTPEDNTSNSLKLSEVEEPEADKNYTIGVQKYLSLLPQLPGIEIQPEDFRIGALHNKGETSQETHLIEKTIADFFDSMKKQNIDRSLLYDEDSGEKTPETETSEEDDKKKSNPELYRILMYHIENKNIPQNYRIGRITIDKEDRAHVEVRVFGEKGETQGVVYVIRIQNKWYISDIQINFYDIEIPAEDDQDEFLPTTYQWIFQGK